MCDISQATVVYMYTVHVYMYVYTCMHVCNFVFRPTLDYQADVDWQMSKNGRNGSSACIRMYLQGAYLT